MSSVLKLTKAGKRRTGPPEAQVAKTAKVAELPRVYVASDGSGIGVVALALESIPCLGDVVHQFASEEDEVARRVLIHNFRDIQHVYNHPTLRDNAREHPTDLYFNLSPCPLHEEHIISSCFGSMPNPAKHVRSVACSHVTIDTHLALSAGAV